MKALLGPLLPSSSRESVKHFFSHLLGPCRCGGFRRLIPLSNLFHSPGLVPNLPYTDQRGGWKLTKLNPAGLSAYEEVRSFFHHNRILLLYRLRRRFVVLIMQYSPYYAACSQRGSSSVNILLSRINAKSTRMSLRITAQSASVFARGRSVPFFLCS